MGGSGRPLGGTSWADVRKPEERKLGVLSTHSPRTSLQSASDCVCPEAQDLLEGASPRAPTFACPFGFGDVWLPSAARLWVLDFRCPQS